MIYVIELGVDVIMSCVMGDCSWSLCWLVMFYYLCVWFVSLFFFFFQAEDGIRDIGVTGVQTCALPISPDGQEVDVPILADEARRDDQFRVPARAQAGRPLLPLAGHVVMRVNHEALTPLAVSPTQ